MKIEGHHTLNASQEQVWRLLIDPSVMKRCTPGCEMLEAVGDNAYEAVLNVGVGAVKGRYTGRIQLEDLNPPSHLKMVIDGKGPQGFLKGIGVLDMQEVEGGTQITYTGDAKLGGPIASIGQRMLQSSAKLMASQFFTALNAEAAALKEAETANQPVVPPKHGLVRNFFRSLWAWLRGAFTR